jgi:hypothetical protein
MKKPICCNKETYACGANIVHGKIYNIYKCDVCENLTEDLFHSGYFNKNTFTNINNSTFEVNLEKQIFDFTHLKIKSYL